MNRFVREWRCLRPAGHLAGSGRGRRSRVVCPSLLTLLTLALAGCAALIRPPEVSVQAVRVKSVTLSGGTVTLDLRLSNPNNFELKGTAIDYTVRVAEQGAENPRWFDLASGVREDPLTLPALGSTTLYLSLRFDWLAVGAAVRELLDKRRLDYQVEGAVRVEMPGGLRRVPFRQSGKLSV